MISAILLAAGESSRMGKLKQLLPFGSKTVIETCLDNLLNSALSEIIVVLGHCHEQIHPKISRLPVTIAINPDYKEGMSSSIKAGLKYVNPQSEAVLIALVDQPLVGPDVINSLIESYQSAGKKIIIPTYQSRNGHPVIIDLCYRDEMLNLDPAIGLRQVVRAHSDEILRIEISSDCIVQDMDYWEDYLEQLRAQSRLSR